MTQPTAHDLYGWLVQAIDRAVEAKDNFSVTKAAEAFGMIGGEEDYGGLVSDGITASPIRTAELFPFMQGGGISRRHSLSSGTSTS